MKKVMTMLTVSLVAGQLMAQTTKKLAPPPPPPPNVKMQKIEAPPPPPLPPNEINELAPPPLPPPPPSKPPKAQNRKVRFLTPKIVKEKEI